MAILIGVDEAGYGPNYGPLAVAATAWRIDGEKAEAGKRKAASSRSALKRAGTSSPPAAVATAHFANFPDLYKLLRRAVVLSPDQCARRVAIADSKALYKSGMTLAGLERGVLAALACVAAQRHELPLSDTAGLTSDQPTMSVDRCIARLAELLAATCADPHARRGELSCHADDDLPLPIDSCSQDVVRAATLLRCIGEQCGASLVAIRARLVFPAEFNDLCDRFGTKGAALSHITLELLRRVVDEVHAAGAGGGDAPARLGSLPTAFCPPPTFICFDKHGGRNRYAALLQHHFPEGWINAIHESRDESRYTWRHNDATIEAIFRVRGEAMLPTALASMTAKYHRELSMRAFNAFWTARIPGLRPTAGYPRDATRFRTDIAAKQRELGIDDRLLWRFR